MVLTETHIRKIVSESLSKILMEFDMGGAIGRSGHIMPGNMIDPSVEFADELKRILDIKKKQEENPNFRYSIKREFGNTEAYKVWLNYYNAMMSRPGKKALKFPMWLQFVCLGKRGQKIMGYEVDGSYLFGFWIRNNFIACYFAPVGYAGMAKLLKGICQYDNIIFAVTQDLSPMLERLGIPKSDETCELPWRKKMVTKDVFGTSLKAIKMGFKILKIAKKLKK